jgi:hypothetical protein
MTCLCIHTVVGADEYPVWIRIWNALGALDLIVAVSLGLLSAPGTPFRLLIHLTIAAKLRSVQRTPQAAALAG